jgi:hypothetical protein
MLAVSPTRGFPLRRFPLRRASKHWWLVGVVAVSNSKCSVRKIDSLPTNIPKLPNPSGPFGVGRVAFDWIDPNRVADMVDNPATQTELMVYVWYPSDTVDKEVKGILFPGATKIDSAPEVPASLKNRIFGGDWPLVVSGAIASHAQEKRSDRKES